MDFLMEMLKEIQSDLQEHGNAVAIRARNNHPTWSRKSGNLDRSHTADVRGLTLTVYLDEEAGILDDKSGVNYGVAQHQGTSRGIAGDPWLYRAYDEQEQARPIEKTIADTIIRVTERNMR